MFRFAQNRALLTGLCLTLSLGTAWLLCRTARGLPAKMVRDASAKQEAGRGMHIVEDGGYPELRVDGKPFFIHSAAFPYYRIPRERWSFLLGRYRHMGINTVDIYIPWNWHEPRAGAFDFAGQTNPRRDLRGLLHLIAENGLKLIARPGPEILNEWRNGGYPAWLLAQPEYQMDTVDIREGRYPPLAILNTRNAEEAARGWLANRTHMKYARSWMEAVAQELAPYSAARSVAVRDGQRLRKVSGPLLFVQLDDDMAIGRTNYVGPQFWRYMETLRSFLHEGGLRVPVFINPTDMRVSASGAGLADPIGAMGQWYMPPRAGMPAGEESLDDQDAAQIEFYSQELETEPRFPPVMIEYQAGWYTPGDDDRPAESPESNTLLSSRLLIGSGVHGFNYFPLQDTITPAGYSVPWVNRFYRWDAPLDLNGDKAPRARAVLRNAGLLGYWGPWLAASHVRPDFGIAYPLGAFPQKALSAHDIEQVSRTVLRLERLGQIAHLSSELLDPQYQPVGQLLRDAVIVLPVFAPENQEFLMSEKSEEALVAYVERGGTLVVYPRQPAGKVFSALWNHAVAVPSDAGIFSGAWKYGGGEVLLISRDFASAIRLATGFGENAQQAEAQQAPAVLQAILQAGHVRPAVKLSAKQKPDSNLVVTELISNDGTGLFGERRGGTALASVTNLSDRAAERVWDFLSPQVSSRTSDAAAPVEPDGPKEVYIPMRVRIPPRESLLLPIEQPLCDAPLRDPACQDRVVAAGAELLGAQREGNTLELQFYAPALEHIRLRLQSNPAHVNLSQNLPRVHWEASRHELTLSVPRGAAPDYLRELKLRLHYRPQVAKKPKENTQASPNYSVHVLNSIPLMLGNTASLRSDPPLVSVERNGESMLMLEAEDPSTGREVDIHASLQGPLHGSTDLEVKASQPALDRLKLNWPSPSGRMDRGIPAGPDGLLRETLNLHSKFGSRRMPIEFLLAKPKETSAYQFDFDSDGEKEWVLENSRLRVVVSPGSGGRVWSLVDKHPDLDLISSVGAFRDGFSYTKNPPDVRPSRARGKYGLFNRPYQTRWGRGGKLPEIEMHYEASDVLPAGAEIEKTIRLVQTGQGVEAQYRVSLQPVQEGKGPERPQAFVVESSLPATARGQLPTQLCWGPDASSEARGAPAGSASKVPAPCEGFEPGGKTMVLPAGTRRVEVRTKGKPRVAVEWQKGEMTVEQKLFSVLLRLEFPPLVPGGAAATYSLRLEVLPEH